MKDKPLAAELKAFLEASKRVSRTQVHQVIKEFYQGKGNWRMAPRGDPHKGGQKRKQQIEGNGY